MLALLTYGPHWRLTMLVFFFARLALPALFALYVRSVRLRRPLSAGERRMVQQRGSRLLLAAALCAVSLRALLSSPGHSDPWLAAPSAGLLAVSAMTWYLIADSLDLLYSRLFYSTPLQLDLWIHHLVLLAYLYQMHLHGAAVLFNCQAFLGEFMALFSGSVFLFSILDSKHHPWSVPLVKIANAGRKLTLIARFLNWTGILYLANAYEAPNYSVYVSLMCGLCVAYAMDTYWGLVFFGVLRGKNEIKKD